MGPTKLLCISTKLQAINFFFCDVSLCSLVDGNDLSEELLLPFFTLNIETAGSPET